VPTWDATERFRQDYSRLSGDQHGLFLAARDKLVEDLRGGSFRKGLRVKAVRATPGVYEMTWAPDGRATFHYGPSRGSGAHVVRRRIGTRDIFDRP
jgi:hypothetical protein